MATSDEQLMKAVGDAARARVAPEQAEARVGRRAIVDTTRGDDQWRILRSATMYPEDPPRTQPLRFEGARHVVYWSRDIAAHNAPIVGIVWKTDGGVELFTAFVLPP